MLKEAFFDLNFKLKQLLFLVKTLKLLVTPYDPLGRVLQNTRFGRRQRPARASAKAGCRAVAISQKPILLALT